MKVVISLFIYLLAMGNNNPCFIKGKGFEGYIFDKEHFVLVSIENQSERYTPSKEDILLAEKLLRENLEDINNPLINQGDNCPVIHKKLKKYIRQYVGFINESGEKVIWINFIWDDKSLADKVSKEIVSVLDGCSHYWKVKINLKEEKLFDLQINGSA